MLIPNLLPRLNVEYPLNDFIYSLSYLTSRKHPYQRIHKLFGHDRIFFANHARTGLRLVLSALDLPNNSHIGVQPYNCHTVFQAISRAGHKPVFIDIGADYTLDRQDLLNKVNRIDALIVTHLFGIPADLDEISDIAVDIPIIEDCAHSFLSTYKGRLTGTFGDASIFSFGPAKFPSIGKGGYVLINNNTLHIKFTSLYKELHSNSIWTEITNVYKNLMMSTAYKRPIYGLFSYPIGKKIDNKIDFAGKFAFQDAKGLNSNISLYFRKFDSFSHYFERQRSNAEFLINELQGKFEVIRDTETKRLNFFLFPLRAKNRDYLIDFCLKREIELGKHFSDAIHWAEKYGYIRGSCPKAENTVEEILAIPCHYNYPRKSITKAADCLKRI
jgi:dTDP-4-amino-4,6-dideoxygalactose transaminase